MPKPDLFDPCSRKHGDSETSSAAFGRCQVKSDEARVLELVRAAGGKGLTLEEAALAMQKQKNEISGRFTALGQCGAIERRRRIDGTLWKRNGFAVWWVK